MNTTIKTDGCKPLGNTPIKDESHKLFDSSFWEGMDLFPPRGNERFLSLSHMEFCGGNLNYSQSMLRPSDTLHCQDSKGSEILIPSAELKVYATQDIQHEWGIRSTIFFWHKRTDTTFFLSSDFSWNGSGNLYEGHELVFSEPLYALPLGGKESVIIDAHNIHYHNRRWFKIQSLTDDEDW